jgi:hypothetical protein
MWLQIRSCEHNHEISDFIKDGQSLEQLSHYELLKKDPAPRTGFHCPSIGSGPVVGFCEHGNKPSDSTEVRFLLSSYMAIGF